MKTRQGTGYFQQAYMILLLCLVSSIVSAGSAFALTGNKIDQCYDCHGSSGDMRPLDTTASSLASYRNISTGNIKGNHRSHMRAAAPSANTFICSPCHVVPAVGDFSHRNGVITLNSNINNSTPPGTYYKGASAVTFWNQTSMPVLGTCQNINCHFQATTPTWGSAEYVAPTDCNQCHGNPPSGGATGADGSHTGKHATYFPGAAGCVKCHTDHLSEANTFSHATSAGKRNLSISLKNANNAVGGTYNGPLNDYLPNQTNVFGTCTATYCHSDGTKSSGFTVVTVPTWGVNTLTCGSCHSATGTSVGHSRHVGGGTNYSFNCADCHNATVSIGSSVISNTANHVNGTVDVSLTSGTYSGSNIPGDTFGSCTNVSCHSNGKSVFQSVNWGLTGTLTCDSCHPLASLGGAHARHAGGLTIATVKFYNYTANKSTGQDTTSVVNYAFGCANCHPMDKALHANGTVNVEVNAVTGNSVLRAKTTTFVLNGTVGTNSVTCSNVYCHSNGQGANTTTLAWNQTYAAVDRCAQCHGNSPTSTGAHVAHVVGVHSDDVYNGGVGKLAAGNTGNVSHGILAQATTINCDTCHWSTVQYARNRNNSSCSTSGCHPTAVDTATTQVARVMLTSHVNGTVEVAFRPIKIVSKAQLRDASFVGYTGGAAGWSRGASNYKNGAAAFDTAKNPLNSTAVYAAGMPGAGTCSNIVCHNMKSGDSVKWNTALSCLDCHNSL
jgi:predicted CxxxxCH...CXXCH cytochrome family protein